MVECFTSAFRGSNCNFEIILYLRLPIEVFKTFRSQAYIQRRVFCVWLAGYYASYSPASSASGKAIIGIIIPYIESGRDRQAGIQKAVPFTRDGFLP